MLLLYFLFHKLHIKFKDDIMSLEKAVNYMGNEDNNMTDEQFKTYNQLLELVEELIEELTNDKKKEYKEKRNDILLKK